MISLLLVILAIVLSVILYPIGFLYALVTFRLRLKDYYYAIAISIDQLGNVVMAAMFNKLLIEEDAQYKFGNPDWTISAVLGGNLLTMRLRPLGLWFVKILDSIDDNHCINAFENETKRNDRRRKNSNISRSVGIKSRILQP